MHRKNEKWIRARAYAIWEEEGRPHGKHIEHWDCAIGQLLAMEEEDRAYRARASTISRISVADPPLNLSQAYDLGATECLICAEQLDKGRADLTGEFILALHALELGLKAFLLNRGMREKQLWKNFGHNLTKLFEEAVDRGLMLEYPDAEKMIRWLNEWHCDRTKIRYEFIEQRTLPMCETIFPLIREILLSCK